MLHGSPANRRWIPLITPAIAEHLYQEMLEIRKEFQKELKQMWTIDPREARIACKYGGRLP
jgi:hypothetical protein